MKKQTNANYVFVNGGKQCSKKKTKKAGTQMPKA